MCVCEELGWFGKEGEGHWSHFEYRGVFTLSSVINPNNL